MQGWLTTMLDQAIGFCCETLEENAIECHEELFTEYKIIKIKVAHLERMEESS